MTRREEIEAKCQTFADAHGVLFSSEDYRSGFRVTVRDHRGHSAMLSVQPDTDDQFVDVWLRGIQYQLGLL